MQGQWRPAPRLHVDPHPIWTLYFLFPAAGLSAPPRSPPCKGQAQTASQGARPGHKLRNHSPQVLIIPGPTEVAHSSFPFWVKVKYSLGDQCPGAAQTNPPTLGSSNNRHLLTPISGGCMSEVRVWAGLVLSEAPRETLTGSHKFWSSPHLW